MRSQLAKVGWNFEAGQRLEFSYLQTQIASPNASMLSEVLALSPSGKEITKIGWRNTSFTNVENRNIALDYRLNPEHISWLDATAKIHYVDTNDETDNANSFSGIFLDSNTPENPWLTIAKHQYLYPIGCASNTVEIWFGMV